MGFEFDPNKFKNQEFQSEMPVPQQEEAPEITVSSEQFANAIKDREGLLMGISGFDRLDSVQKINLKKHEKIIKEFIEQKKAEFFDSLPESMQGHDRIYNRDELKAFAQRAMDGAEEQMLYIPSVELRNNLREILGLMKKSGLDEYDLDKKNEPSKKAEDWVPYNFSARK